MRYPRQSARPRAEAREPALKARHLTLVPREAGWRSPSEGRPEAPPWRIGGRSFYLSVRVRFAASVAAAVAWAAGAFWLSLGWIEELARWVTLPVAVAAVAGVAVVPAYLNAHILASLALDRPRPLRFLHRTPAVTILVATRDDEERIGETLEYALRSDYPGELVVVVADDGSRDGTRRIVGRLVATDTRLRLLELPRAGKAQALDAALARVSTPLVATIDADTLLMPSALRRAVARFLCSPTGTVAVAGAVYVRNSRDGLLARIQEWDYLLGMSSVKRQQALLAGAVIANGAFSLYELRALREAGAWPDRIRPDAVVSLALVRNGGRTTFEPTAVAFTTAPTGVDGFVRQRQRWARGMLEALREHGGALLARRSLESHTIAASFCLPYLDAVYTCAALPGIVLAANGSFALLGPIAVSVLPVGVATAVLVLLRQRRDFRRVGLRIRWNPLGFVLYLLAYQLVVSPVSFVGYAREVVRARRDR